MKNTILTEWIKNNYPKETMIGKSSFEHQINFFLFEIPRLISVSYADYITRPVKVISTHQSKSMKLPVCRYTLKNGVIIMLRNNLHDWKISVNCPDGITIDADFMDLFDPKKEILAVYCQGFKRDWVFDCYDKNK